MSGAGELKARQLRYIVIGAGMAGLLAGIKLKEDGDSDFVIFEKGNAVGGTWRDNRYPGLACDTPAHCYTYSFAPYAEWSSNYSSGPEIRTYFEKVADQFGMRDYVRLNCEVAACDFDEVSTKWKVRLANGEIHEADVVIAASGVLHHPNIPHFEGIENFKGKCFHSARWDDEAVVDGARVAVIGSGSTGVQIVSALSERSARVVHLQRSPQWILPTEYFQYSEEQKEDFRRDPAAIEAMRNSKEYWDLIFSWTSAIVDADSPAMHEIEETCRLNLENNVKDPVLREKLRPDYRAACKRMIISWNYYDAVQKPNVVVETGAIDRIESEGIRMKDGTLHKVDCIILATGFKADSFIRPAVVTGRGGVTLDEIWMKRATAYYAIMIPGLPNFFMLNGPTGPVGNFPLIDIAEREWGYIEQFLAKLRSGEVKTVEPTKQAHAAYEERRIEAAKRTIFASGCKSWYLDSEGVPSTWPWGYEAFGDAMRNPRFEDYNLVA
jgi:cation diffusion facilitator CzcD-associated flavoprotein CzcO